MCDSHIDGVTQDLSRSEDAAGSMKFYGGRYFVCETIWLTAAKRFAEALGGTFEGDRTA